MDGLQVTYLIVGGIGFVILVVSLLFGMGHDADLGHDLDHDLEHDTELGHDGDVGHDSDAALSEGPSWLGAKVILPAMVGFGLFGFASSQWLPAAGSLPIAVAGFFGMAAGMRQLVLAPLYRQQSNALLSRRDHVGRQGRVTLTILEAGTGEIRFTDLNGAQVVETAVARDAATLPSGTPVLIVDVTESALVVDIDPLTEKE